MRQKGLADPQEVRPFSALWGVLVAALLAASFVPVVYFTRSILGVPLRAWSVENYDLGATDIPAGYWWSWGVGLFVLGSVGLVALLASRTRRIAFVYLPLVALLAGLQMVLLLGYEFGKWDDQWDTGESGRYDSASFDIG